MSSCWILSTGQTAACEESDVSAVIKNIRMTFLDEEHGVGTIRLTSNSVVWSVELEDGVKSYTFPSTCIVMHAVQTQEKCVYCHVMGTSEEEVNELMFYPDTLDDVQLIYDLMCELGPICENADGEDQKSKEESV